VHEPSKLLVVLESDHHCETYTSRALRAQSGEKDGAGKKRTFRDDDADGAAAATTSGGGDVSTALAAFKPDEVQEYEKTFGRPVAPTGRWASCVRVLDAVTGVTHHLLELADNEVAVSLTTCTFASHGDELLLVVGSAQNMTFMPRKASAAFLSVYRFVGGGDAEAEGTTPTLRLKLMHKTPVDDIPGALAPFDGRLLAGCGATLRIYELGKKKLLRKCENRNFPTFIASIEVNGPRIIVGDLAHSFLWVSFKKLENQFHIFADDPTPKWLTASCQVDYDTMAGADKFGNVFVTRLPSSVTEVVDDDATGGRHRWEQGQLNAAPHKADALVHFHVGELVTSIEKTPLVPGGADILLYLTIGGGIGAFVPFISREDCDFFLHLEMNMRQVRTSAIVVAFSTLLLLLLLFIIYLSI
jgi:splicing factor 3B subunit 3